LFNFSSYGQFLQGLQNVRRDHEQGLKNNLANAKSEDSRIFTLVQLGTLYCNSPYPRDSNLKAALYMGRQARQISLRFNSVKGYNDAQLLIAFTFLRREQIDSAIQISKLVNDTTRFT